MGHWPPARPSSDVSVPLTALPLRECSEICSPNSSNHDRAKSTRGRLVLGTTYEFWRGLWNWTLPVKVLYAKRTKNKTEAHENGFQPPCCKSIDKDVMTKQAVSRITSKDAKLDISQSLIVRPEYWLTLRKKQLRAPGIPKRIARCTASIHKIHQM